MRIEAIGPQTATALVASMGNPPVYSSGRSYTASLGITPRQHSSDGKERLGQFGYQALPAPVPVSISNYVITQIAALSWGGAGATDSDSRRSATRHSALACHFARNCVDLAIHALSEYILHARRIHSYNRVCISRRSDPSVVARQHYRPSQNWKRWGVSGALCFERPKES